MLARRRQGTELRTGPSRAIATVVRPLTAAEFVGRSGNHIEHVPIPDAAPGEIDLGNRQVDFARGLKALADAGFAGHTVKLETRYITNGPRLPLAPPN